jgi:hypothetical protein
MIQNHPFPIFRNAIDCVRERCKGLAQEFEAIIANWENSSDILMDSRMLPKVVRGYLDREAKIDFEAIRIGMDRLNDLCLIEDSRRQNQSTIRASSIQDVVVDIDERLESIAVLLDILKTTFYQRTDCLEMPYILAVLPGSPERSWGKEFYILAADELTKNYSAQINWYGRVWDGFASYYPEPGGGFYTPFRTFFHVSLAEDTKYFLPGFFGLAHEIGHAACETRNVDLGEGRLIPEVVYRLLRCIFNLKDRIWKRMSSLPRPIGWGCTDCDHFLDIVALHCDKYEDEGSFIREVGLYRRKMDYLFVILEQFLADSIALEISGPNYLRATFSYLFDFPLTVGKSNNLVLADDFKEALFRVFACNSYAFARGYKWKDLCNKFVSQMENETLSAFRNVENIAEIRGCVHCMSRLGNICGRILGDNYGYVMRGVFKGSKSIFEPITDLEKKLKDGTVVTRCQPRQVLHAYYNLLKDSVNSGEFPAALYSLVNSRQKSKQSLNIT